MSLRIAFVAPFIVKSTTGLGSYIESLLPRLCDRGHKVALLASDCTYRGLPPDDLVDIDPRAELSVFRVTGWLNRRIYRSPEFIDRLRKQLTAFDVVDIQGLWFWIAADAARVCHEAHVPYILTPHGMMTHWDWAKRPLAKRLFFHFALAKTWSSASAVRFLSVGELNNSMVSPSGHFSIIPNAIAPAQKVNPEGALLLRKRLNISPTAPLVLFLGRVTAQKGVLEIVQAFDLAWRQCPTATLVIAGPLDGEYGQQVKRQVASLACRNQIRLLGPVFGEDKQALLSTADLFMTLSRNDGLSIAALEALSHGVPAIVTESSNLPEVSAFKAGIITDLNAGAAADAILTVLRDEQLRQSMRNNARLLAAEKFSWEAVMPQLERFYGEVAAGRTVSHESPLHSSHAAHN